MENNSVSRRLRRLAVVGLVLIVAGLAVSACGSSSNPGADEQPATVEPIKGTNINRLTLTKQAMERLGIRTTPIRNVGGREIVPDAAVLYDPDGKTFTYTSPKPLTFIRREITVDHINGTKAVLKKGPPAGTAVVTVGSPELVGLESEYEPE